MIQKSVAERKIHYFSAKVLNSVVVTVVMLSLKEGGCHRNFDKILTHTRVFGSEVHKYRGVVTGLNIK